MGHREQLRQLPSSCCVHSGVVTVLTENVLLVVGRSTGITPQAATFDWHDPCTCRGTMNSGARHVQHNVGTQSSPAAYLQGMTCNMMLNYMCTQHECSTPNQATCNTISAACTQVEWVVPPSCSSQAPVMPAAHQQRTACSSHWQHRQTLAAAHNALQRPGRQPM